MIDESEIADISKVYVFQSSCGKPVDKSIKEINVIRVVSLLLVSSNRCVIPQEL